MMSLPARPRARRLVNDFDRPVEVHAIAKDHRVEIQRRTLLRNDATNRGDTQMPLEVTIGQWC